MKRLLWLACLSFSFITVANAENKVIWKGEVHSNGTPSETISLLSHKSYQIKASGFVNLGKWIQNKHELADDACYEYSQTGYNSKSETLKNSSNISVCDGTYHQNHIYESKPFKADQNRIHFWVHDLNYDDNSGALTVEIIELE